MDPSPTRAGSAGACCTVSAEAESLSLPSDYVTRVFTDQINATEAIQYSRFSWWKLDPAAAPTSAPDLCRPAGVDRQAEPKDGRRIAGQWPVLHSPDCRRGSTRRRPPSPRTAAWTHCTSRPSMRRPGTTAASRRDARSSPRLPRTPAGRPPPPRHVEPDPAAARSLDHLVAGGRHPGDLPRPPASGIEVGDPESQRHTDGRPDRSSPPARSSALPSSRAARRTDGPQRGHCSRSTSSRQTTAGGAAISRPTLRIPIGGRYAPA